VTDELIEPKGTVVTAAPDPQRCFYQRKEPEVERGMEAAGSGWKPIGRTDEIFFGRN